MRKILKRIYVAAVSIFSAIIMVVAGAIPATIPTVAKADTVSAYETSNVLEDLKGSTVNGKEFSLLEYGFNAFKDTQVISFVEYCYSFYPTKQENYNLYVYVYNPKGLFFDVDSSMNKIQLAYGNGQAYEKYALQYLNRSEETNYEGLFYKYKVKMTSEQRKEMLLNQNSSERVYKVSGIELQENGKTNANEYSVATTYYYSGYAVGFGSNAEAENTLVCKSEQAEVLSLNVKPTVYRPDGSNGKSEWHQDSLHSVYFAVPNDILQKYGMMSAVHATWLNAVLAPALVTGNYNAYSAILSYLGENLPSTDKGYHTDDLYYMYYGGCVGAGAGFSNATCYYGYSYNAMSGWSGHSMLHTLYGEAVNPLYMMYYASGGIDSADDYAVSSEEILSKLKESKVKYPGELVLDKYNRCMFESVDKEFTEVNIRAEETYSLTEQKIDKAWWNGLFGVDRPDKITTTVFDNIQAIYAVKDSDLSGTKAEVAKRLYISEADYDDFKAYYEANKNVCTVYLFRYQTSDYISQEATLYEYYPDGSIFTTGKGWQRCDTNAYFFQQTVNLDFDIIDVTFSNGIAETVIPVASNPMDIIPDATPPLVTQSDMDEVWWRIIVGLLLLLLVVVIFWPVIQFLLRGAVWIISLPFKGIKVLIKENQEESKKNNDENS